MKELKITPESYNDITIGDYIFHAGMEWTAKYLGTTVLDGAFRLVGETDEGDLIVAPPDEFIKLT